MGGYGEKEEHKGGKDMRRGEGGTGFSYWFKRTSQASGHHAGLMWAVCSRRARRVIPRNRLLLSVAERWALLVRKARGIQILRHVHAYSGHALQLLYQ